MNEQPSIRENLHWAHPPTEGLPLWAWLVIIAVLTAIVVAGVLWFRRRRLLAAAEAAPARPPHEIAREALQRLRDLLAEDRDMDFVIEASRILRAYIQARFGLRAPHRSTEEFLAEASASELLTTDYQEMLSRFLSQCDLVKFARKNASIKQMERMLVTAETFVNETAQEPEPANPS